MRLHEVTRRRYYHGSKVPLEIGTVLEPRGGLVDDDVEQIIERFRPRSKPARSQSVYMVKNVRDLDVLALGTEHVYAVEPQGRVSGHDHQWINQIWNEIVKAEESGREPDEARLRLLARGYWSGKEFWFEARWPRSMYPPQMEYLTQAATILSSPNALTETAGRTFTVFHGTNAKFKRFGDRHKGTANGTAPINMTGFNFTDNPDVARTFGENVLTCRVTIERPFVVNAKGKGYSEFKHILNNKLEDMDRSKYDGVIIKNYGDVGIYGDKEIVSTHYIPFSTAQIKIVRK